MSEPKLITDEAHAFADLWYDARAANGMLLPTKDDFPLRRLAPFMPNMALVSFEKDNRAKYELFGTMLAELAGIDLTGQYLDETQSPEARRQREKGLAAFHAEAGPDAYRARWSIGQARMTSGRLVKIEDLALPYLDEPSGEMRHMNFATVLGTLEYGEGMTGFIAAEELIWFDAALERPDWLRKDHTPSRPEPRRAYIRV